MRKFVLMAALLALLVVAALPALADKGRDNGDRKDGKNHQQQRHNGGGGGGGGGSSVSQESEQETESGDLDQSFTVTSSGDNSNQCAGIQGVGNTGNAQNLTNVIQYGSEADDIEFDEVNSSIDVSPTNTTECDQQVNQAATASGGGGAKPVK